MIDLSADAETRRQELVSADPRFRLDPPGAGLLVATGPVEFRRVEGKVAGTWRDVQARSSETPEVFAVLTDMIARSRRDVERSAGSARPHVNLGLALMKTGLLEEAAGEFSRALALDPKEHSAEANLARIRVLQGNLVEGEKLYSHLRESAPQNASVLMSLAFVSARRGLWDHAISLLQDAIRLDEDAPLPRYNLARVYLTLGRKHEAIAQLKVASRSDVRSPSFHQGLGVAYALAGEFGRAERSFRTALTLAPDTRDALYGLCVVLLATKKPQEVVTLLSTRPANRALDREGVELLARAYFDLGNYKAAQNHLTIAMRLVEETRGGGVVDLARITNNLGVCAVFQRDVRQAEQLLKRAIEMQPGASPIPYHNLARAYLDEKRAYKAQEILEQCQQIFPSDDTTRVLRAIALESQNSQGESMALLREVIRSEKAPAAAFAILGALLADEARDLDQALAVIRRGNELHPGNPLVLNNLAYVHLRRGESAPARDILKRIRTDATIDVAVTATRGLLLIAEGDLEQGKQFYRAAERMARQGGNRDLAEVVRQKMHLELARAYARSGQSAMALREIQKGLRIKGRESFSIDLKGLEQTVVE